MIASGLDINHQDKDGNAVSIAFDEENYDVVKYLSQKGFSLDPINKSNYSTVMMKVMFIKPTNEALLWSKPRFTLE